MGAEGAGEARWEGEAYAPHAAHHRTFDDWFLARHPPQPGDVVVDAGCGTGEFTARLAGLVPDGRVIGVEPDPSMLAEARQRALPNMELRQGRLQHLDEVCGPGAADLVVSRAVFHWLQLADYGVAYEAVRRTLRPGGWLHAESGGAGNVAGVRAVLDELATARGLGPAKVSFPDAGTALELLEAAGFHVPDGGVTTVAQRRAFDRDALAGFVRTQAVVAYVGDQPADVREAFVEDALGNLDRLRRHDGTHDQTFVRLDVLAQRPADG